MVWVAHKVEEQIHISEWYSIFQRWFQNGYTFSGESHNFWECLYVLSGDVCVSGDERVYNLTRGEIVFHKPLEVHKFNVTGSAGADLLIFSFSAEGPLTGYLRNKVFRLSDLQQEIMDSLLRYMRSKMPERSECPYPPKRIPDYNYIPLCGKFSSFPQMITSYVCQLILSLADDGLVASTSQAPDALVFSHAINYLTSNIHRQPSVPEVAAFCNVSVASLKRIFEKYAGVGVHRYLLKIKINAAADLLQDGEHVTDVAERLGFNSASYFTKAFKRETGYTPSEFRIQ
ncbi:MAG: helix-turn-helix transcriptional regulator [Lachnospiraceae bacterium]|nr:helix-turn-helix transcriptional regulator [Lachnospiraceae bacterium]